MFASWLFTNGVLRMFALLRYVPFLKKWARLKQQRCIAICVIVEQGLSNLSDFDSFSPKSLTEMSGFLGVSKRTNVRRAANGPSRRDFYILCILHKKSNENYSIFVQYLFPKTLDFWKVVWYTMYVR